MALSTDVLIVRCNER